MTKPTAKQLEAIDRWASCVGISRVAGFKPGDSTHLTLGDVEALLALTRCSGYAPDAEGEWSGSGSGSESGFVPDAVIRVAADLIRQRRADAEPPPVKWAQIVRGMVEHNLPGLPEDAREALVTLGLWVKVVDEKTARSPTPLLNRRRIDHLWADFATGFAKFLQETGQWSPPNTAPSATTSGTRPTPPSPSSERRSPATGG